jgi:hypothetical protein
MHNELRDIINQAAAQNNLTVTNAALEHLEKYDDMWRSRGGGQWNTVMIQAVLADSAIKKAEKNKRKEIIKEDVEGAILSWKKETDPPECLTTGLNIMDEFQKSNLADRLHPKIAAYVKDIGSGNSQTRTA